MTPDEAIERVSDVLLDLWVGEHGQASMEIHDLARQIIKHPKLLMQTIIECSNLRGQEVMELLVELELADDLQLEEGEKIRRVWVPVEPHAHVWRWIRLVHGESLAFVQCSECNEALQINAPSDLFQLPIYHAPG